MSRIRISSPSEFNTIARSSSFSHLSTLLVHYATISYRLGGEKLTINPETEGIVGNERAQALLTRTYRSPWAVEDIV